MKEIKTNNAPAAIGPYSQAIEANGMIFVSGQIPVDPHTGVIKSDVKEAAHQSLTNMKNILLEAGSDMSKVIKVSIFLKNIEDFALVNEVYATYFNKPYPARSCVAVKALPKDVVLEMEAIALK
jgi:2-iminobutanoate/2-iminopropanoate deaminase